MKLTLIIALFFVLCQLAISQSDAVEETDKLMLVHADKLQGQKVGEENVRQFLGHVKFKQGKAVLTCDNATQFELAGRFVLSGNVAFVDTARSLFGDKVTYYDATRITYIEGHARLVDSSKTLTSDRLRYLEKEEQAFADGHVFLTDNKENVSMRGAHTDYDREKGYAKMTGDAVLTKIDSTDGDSLVIFGGLFEMFDDGDRFVVTDSVRLLRGEIEALCDSLEYLKTKDLLKLANNPGIHQGRQYLTGRSVSLLLDDAKVRAIHIVGDAIAATTVDSTLKTNVAYDLLTGQDMMVYVTDEKIDSVRIKDRATSYYHVIEDGREKGLNKALGDALFITFQQDTLKSVRVHSSPGASVGEFHPPAFAAAIEKELTEQLAKLNIKTKPPATQSEIKAAPEADKKSKGIIQKK